MKIWVIHTWKNSSFIFNKCFIVVRVTVNQKPISGTQGTRQKYTLTHTLTHFSAPTSMFLGGAEPKGNPYGHKTKQSH